MTARAVNQPALDQWEVRQGYLRDQLKVAESRLARLPQPSATPDDPAYVNLKDHRKNLDRDIDQSVALASAHQLVERVEARVRGHESLRPVPVTLDELQSATYVRFRFGWRALVRVNRATVTVGSGYSWTDRHPLVTILAVMSLHLQETL